MSKVNTEEMKAYAMLATKLVDEFYKKQNAGLLANLSKRNYEELSASKEKVKETLRKELSEYVDSDGREMTEEEKDLVLEFVRKEMWGYGIIDDLIHDPDISDIKTYSAKNVRIKKKGKRYEGEVEFEDNKTYNVFVTRLLERNKINLGTANAIQTFTDMNQEGFILRITAISGLLTDTGLPCIAFRKIPKDKFTLETLKEAGMFDAPLKKKQSAKIALTNEKAALLDLQELLMDMVNSKGILFTGKGASGKTTLMNALIAEIPHDESIMICQENSELFDNYHPDLLAAHVMTNGGDSKVSYDLGDLTRAALLVDLDRVIVGEVKEGSEAAGLSKASMTGHKCWTSVHGESCEMAVEKMADYISQATGYGTKESLKQLTGFEYVVHLRNFKVDEIVRIDGWDKEKDEIILTQVYPFKEVAPCLVLV